MDRGDQYFTAYIQYDEKLNLNLFTFYLHNLLGTHKNQSNNSVNVTNVSNM